MQASMAGRYLVIGMNKWESASEGGATDVDPCDGGDTKIGKVVVVPHGW